MLFNIKGVEFMISRKTFVRVLDFLQDRDMIIKSELSYLGCKNKQISTPQTEELIEQLEDMKIIRIRKIKIGKRIFYELIINKNVLITGD